MSARTKATDSQANIKTKSAASVPSGSRFDPSEIDHAVIERRVRKAGMDVIRREPLPDGLGIQYVLLGGGRVNVYFTGVYVIAGKPTAGQRKSLEKAFHTR